MPSLSKSLAMLLLFIIRIRFVIVSLVGIGIGSRILLRSSSTISSTMKSNRFPT